MLREYRGFATFLFQAFTCVTAVCKESVSNVAVAAWQSKFDLETLISGLSAMKGSVSHPVVWVQRQDSLPLRGKRQHVPTGEQTLTQHRSTLHRVNARLFTLVLIRFLSPFLFTFFASSISRLFFFCIVEFLQLFQLFHCYLGISTRENNGASCYWLLCAAN